MFVCRAPEVLSQHVRNSTRGRTSTGDPTKDTAYPLIALEGPTGTPGGYFRISPHQPVVVITFGLAPRETAEIRDLVRDAIAPSGGDDPGFPPYPATNHAPIGGDFDWKAGEKTAHSPDVHVFGAETMRMVVRKRTGHRIRHGCTFQEVNEGTYGMKWEEIQRILGTVLYDPRRRLTGWNHILQWDKTVAAFCHPHSFTCFSWTVELIRAGRIFSARVPFGTDEGDFLHMEGYGPLDAALAAGGRFPKNCFVCGGGTFSVHNGRLACSSCQKKPGRRLYPVLETGVAELLKGCVDRLVFADDRKLFVYGGTGGAMVFLPGGPLNAKFISEALWALLRHKSFPPKRLVLAANDFVPAVPELLV